MKWKQEQDIIPPQTDTLAHRIDVDGLMAGLGDKAGDIKNFNDDNDEPLDSEEQEDEGDMSEIDDDIGGNKRQKVE